MAAKPVPGGAGEPKGLPTKAELEAAADRAYDLADALGFVCARFRDACENWPAKERATAENAADAFYLMDALRHVRGEIEDVQAFMLSVVGILNDGRRMGEVSSIPSWPPSSRLLADIGVTRPWWSE